MRQERKRNHSKTNSYYALNMRIKSQLCSIIDEAFADEKDNLERYKGFSFYLIDSEKATSSGMYTYSEKRVEVYNPSLGASHLAKCALHEVSHHIDFIKNGKSGHQKPFYEIYSRLIYASLDLGVLTKDDFYDEWSSDGSKVRKIVERYKKKQDRQQAEEKKVIKVFNAFSIKEHLKTMGYNWNGLELSWDKETNDIETEEEHLKGLGIHSEKEQSPYYIVSSNTMLVDAMISIVAEGNTYECKETLKEYGFVFDKNKKIWKRKVRASTIASFIKELKAEKKFMYACIKFKVYKGR